MFSDASQIDLDTRTKLVLLILTNIIAFTQRSLKTECTLIFSLSIMLIVFGMARSSFKFLLTFGFCLLLQYYIFPVLPEFIGNTFFILVSYARRILPCIMVGTLIVKKSKLREIMEALRLFKVSENLIIPLSITLRYFPTLKEEIQKITDALKLRNIHGIKKIECYLVPIIVSASNTAEELTAAAITRGMEDPCKKTTMLEFKIGFQDIICVAIALVFCIISIFNIW